MKPGAVLLVWLALMALLGIEFVANLFPGIRLLPLAIGAAMAALVGLTFMRLPQAGGIAKVFAIAGLFWLCVLLGMGSLDPATRHDVAVARPSVQ